MEYIYSALVLHAAGKDITDEAITSILENAGIEADAAKVKALTASLEGIDIDDAIATTAVAAAAPAAAAPAGEAPAAGEEPKQEDEEEEEEEVSEEEAAAGLGALFG
jgi:large subunit ribosomal protein L12